MAVSCLAGGVLAMLIGLAGTTGSLAISLGAASSHALGPEQKRTAVQSSLSAASWFTLLSLGSGSVLLVAGVGALGVALQRRVAAARGTASRRCPNRL